MVAFSIRRTLDATSFNAVANDAAVRPWLGGLGPLDLTDVVSNARNYALECEGGGYLCIWRDNGLYEVHSLFLPSARRGRTAPAMRDAMLYMFARTDCVELVTRVPDDNERAASLAAIGGFSKLYRRERSWPSDSGPIGAEHYGLTALSWALRSPECAAAGSAFHEQLEAAKAASGSIAPVHAHDPVHDAVAGAAALMANAGNAGKGVAFYNRWAVVSGYATIALLSIAPPVIDVVDAVVEAGPAGMAVLLCR